MLDRNEVILNIQSKETVGLVCSLLNESKLSVDWQQKAVRLLVTGDEYGVWRPQIPT